MINLNKIVSTKYESAEILFIRFEFRLWKHLGMMKMIANRGKKLGYLQLKNSGNDLDISPVKNGQRQN